MDYLIPHLDECKLFLPWQSSMTQITRNIKGFDWWMCYCIERLASSKLWLEYYRASVNENKEKSSLEESMQSWRVMIAQPQIMTSFTSEDGEGFVCIHSLAHWMKYSSKRKSHEISTMYCNFWNEYVINLHCWYFFLFKNTILWLVSVR